MRRVIALHARLLPTALKLLYQFLFLFSLARQAVVCLTGVGVTPHNR